MFKVNGVLNHATGDVVACLLGQQGSLQLSEGLSAGADDGFQSLAAVAPLPSSPPCRRRPALGGPTAISAASVHGPSQ
jgi:hypothetical protein